MISMNRSMSSCLINKVGRLNFKGELIFTEDYIELDTSVTYLFGGIHLQLLLSLYFYHDHGVPARACLKCLGR